MANRAYLVGSSNAATAGPGKEGINYNPDTEILAGASSLIPVLWLSLFDESHIRQHVIEDIRIPAPVCEAATSRRLLQERRAKVLSTFAQFESRWNVWEQLINEADFQFFKLDPAEVWDLEPEDFEACLPSAIRWFSSGSADDFGKLLSIAMIPMVKPRGFLGRLAGKTPSGYDLATKTLVNLKDALGRPDSIGHHAHGYSWVRNVPWIDGDAA